MIKDQFPKEFRDILAKYGIFYDEEMGYVANRRCIQDGVLSRKYSIQLVCIEDIEIAWIGLDYIIKKTPIDIEMDEGNGVDIEIYIEGIVNSYSSDRDLCECIFKAIREIYKDGR